MFYAWILSLMVSLQPVDRTPWADTFASTALAIDQVVLEEEPLYRGPDGKERTAALLVSLAWFESRFRVDAVGDHGQSIGLYQVSKAHAPREELLGAASATRVALGLIRESQRVCAGRALPEQLGWYASGGRACGGLAKSRHRMGLAAKLVREHPYLDPDSG